MRAKVEFLLENPFVFLNPYHSFDGILSYVNVMNAKNNGGEFSEKHCKDLIDDLPVRKLHTDDNYVYLASSAFFEDPIMIQLVFSKCFSLRRHREHFPVEQILRKWNMFDAVRGVTASEMVSLKGIHSEKIIYFVDVIDDRKDEFENLLQEIHYIGKKASHGFGRVKSFDVSYRKNYPIKRYYPVGLKEVAYDSDSPVLFLRVNPPYWLTERRLLCQQGSM